jgi:ubiquitin
LIISAPILGMPAAKKPAAMTKKPAAAVLRRPAAMTKKPAAAVLRRPAAVKGNGKGKGKDQVLTDGVVAVQNQLLFVVVVQNTFYQIVKPTDTIDNVKDDIAERAGIDPRGQRLIFNGKQLDGERTIQECNVGPRAKVLIMGSQVAPPPPPAPPPLYNRRHIRMARATIERLRAEDTGSDSSGDPPRHAMAMFQAAVDRQQAAEEAAASTT